MEVNREWRGIIKVDYLFTHNDEAKFRRSLTLPVAVVYALPLTTMCEFQSRILASAITFSLVAQWRCSVGPLNVVI